MKTLGCSVRAQWEPALDVYVVVALIGLIRWSLVNPEKTVEDQKPKPAGLDAVEA
jgi:hypothetical protein